MWCLDYILTYTFAWFFVCFRNTCMQFAFHCSNVSLNGYPLCNSVISSLVFQQHLLWISFLCLVLRDHDCMVKDFSFRENDCKLASDKRMYYSKKKYNKCIAVFQLRHKNTQIQANLVILTLSSPHNVQSNAFLPLQLVPEYIEMCVSISGQLSLSCFTSFARWARWTAAVALRRAHIMHSVLLRPRWDLIFKNSTIFLDCYFICPLTFNQSIKTSKLQMKPQLSCSSYGPHLAGSL